MKVKELMALLAKVNPDMIVITDTVALDEGARQAYSPSVRQVSAAEDSHGDYLFAHLDDKHRDAAEGQWEDDGLVVTPMVLISRWDTGTEISE